MDVSTIATSLSTPLQGETQNRERSADLKRQWLYELEKRDAAREHVASKFHNNCFDYAESATDVLPLGRAKDTFDKQEGLSIQPHVVSRPTTPVEVSGKVEGGLQRTVVRQSALHVKVDVSGSFLPIPVKTAGGAPVAAETTLSFRRLAIERYLSASDASKPYADKNIQVVGIDAEKVIWARDYKSKDTQPIEKLLMELKEMMIQSGYHVKKVMLNGKKLLSNSLGSGFTD